MERSDISSGTLHSFSTYCGNLGPESSLIPKTANTKGYFKVESETKVKCGDLQSSHPTEFSFNKIFDGSQEFSLSCYNTVISPLVNQTLRGESSMAIFGGPPSLTFSNYLTSQTGMHGLISQAATQLLAYLNRDGNRLGRVTFSWYQLDVSSFESVTDILKSASSSSAPDNKGASQLALREIGKGRGMYVPGIWEVEIANGGDVEAVIMRILQMLPIADHSKGHCHTVMQLSITNSAIADKGPEKDKGSKVASANQCIDSPGVGRLTFLMLSELAQRNSSASAASSGEPTFNFDRPYHWNSHLHTTVNWIESKRASPPFHKSRMVLFLRDVLCGRQNASFILLLKPSIESTQTNFQWLELVSLFQRCYNSIKKSVSANTSSTPSLVKAPSVVSLSVMESISANNTSNASSTSSSTAAASFNQLLSDSSLSSSRMPPPPPPVAANNSANNGGLNGNSSLNLNGNSRVSIKDTLNKQNLMPSTNVNASKAKLPDLDGYAQKEVEIALQLTIESQKKEIENLKSMLEMSQERYADNERAYNDLINQLKEEGAFLSKRDQERLKKALRDVADYAIYKDVMETAMVKMQEQIDLSVRENQNLTNQLHISEGSIRKAKSSSEKYTKDLSTAKKVSDLNVNNDNSNSTTTNATTTKY
jgi:hypothetical protein